MTDYIIYTDGDFKSIDVKKIPVRGTDQKDEVDKQDLTKGVKALEDIGEVTKTK